MTTKRKHTKKGSKTGVSSNLQSINVLISITTALFMLGLCGLLVLQASQLGNLIKEKFEIQVFLKKDITENQQKQVKQALMQQTFIAKTNRQSAVTFISKEKAARQLTEQVQEDFQELLDDNPLHDAFLVKVSPEAYEQENLKKIKQRLTQLEGVYEVSIVENLIQEINNNIATISLFFLLFGAFIMVTVFMLVDHIVKISLFAKRLLIRSMQLVGATDTFIRRPFMKQFAVQGGLGGLLATMFLWLFLEYMKKQIEDLALLYSPYHMVFLSIVLVFLGVAIGAWSAYRAASKYLRMSLDELY